VRTKLGILGDLLIAQRTFLHYENSCLLMATNTMAGIPSHKGTEQIEPASAKPQAFLVAAQIPPATATTEMIIAGSPTADNGGSVTNTEPKAKPIAPAEIVKAAAIVGFHVCTIPTPWSLSLIPQFLQNS
jgi:hypothetical protein